MSTFRYRAVGLDVEALKKIIDPGVTVEEAEAYFQVDITITNDDLKTDLDEEMARQGFSYKEQDPTDDRDLIIKSPDATPWTVTVTDEGDFSTDDGGGGGGDIAKLTDTAPVNVTKAAAAAGTGTEAARSDHKHDVATATAVAITDSSNAEGTSTSVARADHTHAHGSRGGGALHADATTSVAGFMTAADKTKLDGITSGATKYATAYVDGSTSTTSPDFVDGLAGSTVSPPVDGDYVVMFDGNTSGSTGNTETQFGISKNSTTATVADSNRRAQGNGGDFMSCSTQTVLTGLVTSDVIRVLYRRSAGSGSVTLTNRRVILIRVTS
jgi:hypothetical protein